MPDLSSLPGVHYQERYVDVSADVSLRVLQWIPESPSVDWPMVLVPGWASVPEGWEDLLQHAARRQPLYYIETREKIATRFSRREVPEDFTIERFCDDLVEVIGVLGPPVNEQVIVTASLGSTLLLHAFKGSPTPPRGLFCISPVPNIIFPWWGGPLTYIPSFTFPPAIALVLLYLKLFRIDMKNAPQQYARYDRSLHSAHPTRMRYSARMFSGFRLWNDLDTVTCPVGVAHAASDTLHDPGDILRLIEITKAFEVEAPSDLYLHSSDVIPDIDAFVAKLGSP